MERKDFLKLLTAAVAGGTLLTYLQSCKKNETAPSVDFTLDLSASSNAALLQSGGSVISHQVIIINNNGSYVALSDICTHEGCALSFNSASRKIVCPCHGASFTLTGSVSTGPANQPLKLYNVAVNGNILHVTG